MKRRSRACLAWTASVVALGCLHEGRNSWVPDELPYWSAPAVPARAVGCATVDVWVSKSGKSGLGLTLALATARPVCRVAILGGTLDAGAATVAAAAAGAALDLAPGPVRHVYLPFAFDNDAAWRAGVQSATATLRMQADGLEVPALRVALAQRSMRPHRASSSHAEPVVRCIQITKEVLGIAPDRLALRLRLAPGAAGCVARFAGVQLLPARPGDRIEQSPARGSVHALPATWVLILAREPAAREPWHLQVDFGLTDDVAIPLDISVTDDTPAAEAAR